MSVVKCGMFPGEVKEYAVESTTSVADLLEMAGIEVGAEMEIKGDGEAITTNDLANSFSIVLVTKRLKGAR